jgi:UDPglucose 6-dehydrogenase
LKSNNPKVCVIGIWHLGSVTAACLADLGCNVVGVDNDKTRVDNLNKAIPPLFEPGLADLMLKGIKAKHLEFTTDLKSALVGANFAIIGFDTKVDDNDQVDLSEIHQTTLQLANWLENGTIVIISSQVPVGTSEIIKSTIKSKKPDLEFDVAYVPENLRLGQAINRFMKPERIVIGADNDSTIDKVEAFFHIIPDQKLRMNLRSAEMTKHALNAFLATSVSFANEIANICDEVGADALKVSEALRLDSRIGPKAMLKPGLGFAGGTLARDIRVLQNIGKKTGYEPLLINAVYEVNRKQNKTIALKLNKIYSSLQNLVIGVFGLTYKPGTSTLRRSASLEIINELVAKGAKVKAYDPKADLREIQGEINFEFCSDPMVAVKGSDALIFVTEWPEFKQLDFSLIKSLMNKPLIIDAQNMLDADTLSKLGFTYLGVGRTSNSQLKQKELKL